MDKDKKDVSEGQKPGKKRNTNGKENSPRGKRTKTKTYNSTDSIAISKQLALKKQKTRVAKRTSSGKTKSCSNGKPMPSLADLEKMFDDSDTEQPSSSQAKQKIPNPSPKNNVISSENEQLSPNTVSTTSDYIVGHIPEDKICQSGAPMPSLDDLEKMFDDSNTEQPSSIRTDQKGQETLTVGNITGNEDKLPSPNTLSKIADRVMDYITKITPKNLFGSITLPDSPPPPVIPMKKRKKGDIHYIVNCDQRPQIPSSSFGSCFGRGGDDYGINNETNEVTISDDEDEPLQKRKKHSRMGKFCKSVFNAHSGEIANKLSAVPESTSHCDRSVTDKYVGSSLLVTFDEQAELTKSKENIQDNKKTDNYENVDTNTSKSTNQSKSEEHNLDAKLTINTELVSFCPLPSTSKDNETFIKNDKLFTESLSAKSVLNVESNPVNDEDIQIIEIPCETITINELSTQSLTMEAKDSSTEIVKSTESKYKPPDDINCNDDCIILVDESSVQNNKNRYEDLSTIIIDDEYINIDIDDSIENDVDEIIDIDSLIEENKAIINKIQHNKKTDSIIEVLDVPDSPSPEVQITRQENAAAATECTSVLNDDSNNTKRTTGINININPNNEVTNLEENTRDPVLEVNRGSRPNLNIPISSGDIIGNIVTNFFQNSGLLTRVLPKVDCLINTLDNLLPRNINDHNRQSTLVQNTYNVNGLERTFTPESRQQSLHRSSAISPRRPRQNPTGILNTQKEKNVANQSRNHKTHGNLSCATINESEKSIVDRNKRNFGECPICMDSLSNNIIASTICGHVFCLKCIQAAIKTSGKRCPTCRKALRGVGYHQLFL